MVERILSNTCDDDWNPNLLLYCDQSASGLPWRSQFKLAAAIPVGYGIQLGAAFQSLPGYLFGTASVGAQAGVAGPSGTPSGTQLANSCWPRYGLARDIVSTRRLNLINGSNFSKLEVAWRLKTDNLGPRPEYKLEGTPLMVNGTVCTRLAVRDARCSH